MLGISLGSTSSRAGRLDWEGRDAVFLLEHLRTSTIWIRPISIDWLDSYEI
jgi:hypothetical protein